MTRYARLKKDVQGLSVGLIVSADMCMNYVAKIFNLPPETVFSIIGIKSLDYVLTFGEQTVILKRDESTDLLEFLDEAPTE